MKKEEVTYIATRYRRGKFCVDKGWKRLDIRRPRKWTALKIALRIAAAISSVFILSAMAAAIYERYEIKEVPVWDVEETVTPPAGLEVVKAIDFEDTPLTAVISKIKEVYGVKVVNVPENADEYRLSLHYEGDAADLVATINDILGTQMSVER